MRATSFVIVILASLAACRTWPPQEQQHSGRGVLGSPPTSPGAAAKPESKPGVTAPPATKPPVEDDQD